MAKHDPVSPSEIRERIGDLETKYAARNGFAAFGENCIAIRKEIDRLKGLLTPDAA